MVSISSPFRKEVLFILLAVVYDIFPTLAQSPSDIPDLFLRQLYAWPQEKMHLHTDKSLYVSGETIRFRTYVVDAANHQPAVASRYVYAPDHVEKSQTLFKNNNLS